MSPIAHTDPAQQTPRAWSLIRRKFELHPPKINLAGLVLKRNQL